MSWLILLWFLTLREEISADSCGDPFQTEDLLPIGCGAEAVFNFSLEKEILPNGSGDGDDEDFVTYVRTTPSTKRTTGSRRTAATPVKTTAVVHLTLNKNASRLPPRFTPSPEVRHSSFQHLLRIHLSSFNQRLSMLESNTLDMKEGIHSLHKQQSFLSAQMKQLVSLHLIGEKRKKVEELEESYTKMEDRLSRLEGRLEILIDGFTALAQEMNKMKRRHISRSPQERKTISAPFSTVLPLFYTTRLDLTSGTSTIMQTIVANRITTPDISTVKHSNTSNRDKDKKEKASVHTRPRATRQPKSNISSKSKAQITTTTAGTTTTTASTVSSTRTKIKSESKIAVGKKPVAKQGAKPNKRKQGKEVTKFQLEPPSHSSRPLQSHQQSNKQDSRLLIENNGHSKKAVRSNTAKTEHRPVQNNLEKKQKMNPSHAKAAHMFVSKESDVVSKKSTTSKKIMSRRTTPRPKHTTLTPSLKTKMTTAKKRSSLVVKRKSNPAPIPPRKERKGPGVINLLQMLSRDQRSSKQKTSQDASLHVVLGRLAIPIKIIPDH